MGFVLSLLFALIFLACLGFLFSEGMWSIAIRLVNVVTSALLAMNYFEPVAKMLEGFADSFTYFWDFVALWAVFAASMIVLRTVTDALSHVKVRFLKVADKIGGGVFAAWIGWVMVCFTAMSLHTAPLARSFFFGAFQPEQSLFFMGIQPDRQWLAFTQKMSYGGFSRSLPKDEPNAYGAIEGESEAAAHVAAFDRDASFLPKYATRRQKLEDYKQAKNAVRVQSSDLVKRDKE
jgi:hypothetical protein